MSMLRYSFKDDWEVAIGSEMQRETAWSGRWVLTYEGEVKLSGRVIVEESAHDYDAPLIKGLVALMCMMREDSNVMGNRPYPEEPSQRRLNLSHGQDTWTWLSGMHQQHWTRSIGELCRWSRARFYRERSVVVTDAQWIPEREQTA